MVTFQTSSKLPNSYRNSYRVNYNDLINLDLVLSVW